MPGYKPETWNPIVGCSKVSPGCDNCYAEKMAFRISQMLKSNAKENETYQAYKWVNGWDGKTAFNTDHIRKPLQYKSPRLVFVCSMGDLFHESVPNNWIDWVYDIIDECCTSIFIILTKRPERMKEYMEYRIRNNKTYGHSWVWLGVTAENQEQANKRIPILLSIPAAKRFVSIEPMLGPVKLNSLIREEDNYAWVDDCLTGFKAHGAGGWYANKLDWVICGGESGSKARPMHPDWVRSVRDQCKEAGTPFFFKQWGNLYPACQLIENKHPEGTYAYGYVEFPSPHNPEKKNRYYKLGKISFGTLLDGVQHHEWPKL